jgi:DNA-binding NarL/FixJ family response regulator
MAKKKYAKGRPACRKSSKPRPRGVTISVQAARPGKSRLTAREEHIFRLGSLGCSVNEIEVILDIAPATAVKHKQPQGEGDDGTLSSRRTRPSIDAD